MKTTIVLDTETTGLLKPDLVDLDQQPYIIEYYGAKIDKDFNLIDELWFKCKPPIKIDPIITKITGITQEYLDKAPVFAESVDQLAEFHLGVNRIVAHNLAFDRGMIVNELRRLESQYAFPYSPEQICTVEATIKMKGHRLNLGKLHTELLGAPHTGAHTARGDVFALVRCYHALVERGVIKL